MKFDDDIDDCNADDDEFATTNRHVYVEDKKSMSELQSKNSPRQWANLSALAHDCANMQCKSNIASKKDWSFLLSDKI